MIPHPQLPLATYRLQFHTDCTHVAHFAGSAWRGAMGHSLRQLACVTGVPDCTGCGEVQRCIYAYVFDTPVPPDAMKMRRYTQAPHPFVLREEPGASSNSVHLYLTLVGRATAHLPVVALALIRAGASKRGIAGRKMKLLTVEQQDETGRWFRIDHPGGALAPEPPATPSIPALGKGPVTIECLSPLRVKRGGRHVTAHDFRFADLFGNLLRRISMLSAFHTETPFETDFRGLMDAARTVVAEVSLRWVELPRHSTRQHADMMLGGVVGSLRIDSAQLAPFWPILWLGQYTHAGAATTMGLGHYRVKQAASLRDAMHDVQMADTGGIASPH